MADEETHFWLARDRIVEAMQERPQLKKEAAEAKLESAKSSAKLAVIRAKLQRVNNEREKLEREIQSERAKTDYQQGQKSRHQEQLERVSTNWMHCIRRKYNETKHLPHCWIWIWISRREIGRESMNPHYQMDRRHISLV